MFRTSDSNYLHKNTTKILATILFIYITYLNAKINVNKNEFVTVRVKKTNCLKYFL